MEGNKKSRDSAATVGFHSFNRTSHFSFYCMKPILPFILFFKAELQNIVSKAVSDENIPFYGIHLVIMCWLNELHGRRKITHLLSWLQNKKN